MRKPWIDLGCAEAIMAGGLCTAAVYALTLLVFFGPLSHALIQVS